jgi:hypothetical protein
MVSIYSTRKGPHSDGLLLICKHVSIPAPVVMLKNKTIPDVFKVMSWDIQTEKL